MFTVYALYSKEFDKIYVGQTSDLDKRLRYYNELSEEGWTKKYRPWIVVYTENSESRSEVLKREKQLKSYRGRVFIRERIAALKEADWLPLLRKPDLFRSGFFYGFKFGEFSPLSH